MEAVESVKDDETRARVRVQAEQLESLATRGRVPDHGRLARHQHVIQELKVEADEVADQLERVNELLVTVREGIEGV